MNRYTVVLTPDAEDGGFTVTVPSLPGCITEGDSREEALDNAKDAIKLYLDDLRAVGEAVPDETAPPQLAAVEV